MVFTPFRSRLKCGRVKVVNVACNFIGTQVINISDFYTDASWPFLLSVKWNSSEIDTPIANIEWVNTEINFPNGELSM